MKNEEFSPKYFFLGLLFGFALCSLMGRVVSKTASFKDFVRFHSSIQPHTQFFPTAHELLATAKHEVPQDKVLVLIGGSSILRGVGQNPEELWTNKLQTLLGNRKYKVLNFANDGATMDAYGGVMYRILKDLYPKTIFVSTCYPEMPGWIEGDEPYTYLFWDAYYKNLLHLNKSELTRVYNIRKTQIKTAAGIEKHLLGYLDSLFYFKDLWNWVGYKYVFTVWSDEKAAKFYRARKKEEKPDTHLKERFQTLVNDRKDFQIQLHAISERTSTLTDLSGERPHILKKLLEGHFKASYDLMFSSECRAKILCLLVKENPYYLAPLSEKMRAAHTLMYDELNITLKDLGYNSLCVGTKFLPEDYVDSRHLAKGGGEKLAEQVANAVRRIAASNNY